MTTSGEKIAAPQGRLAARPGGPARRRPGHEPADRLRALVATALAALDAGRDERAGPVPAGGPAAVRERVLAALLADAAPDSGTSDSGTSDSGTPSNIQNSGIPDGDSLGDGAPAGDGPGWGDPGRDGPDGGRGPRPGGGLLPETGVGETAALAGLARMLAAGSADPADPWCAAHLHCPPLPVAVAADLVVSALNPSLDSWDQAPAATTVETEVVATLAALVGYDPRAATGTITTGGTESNLMGLLLARDACAEACADGGGDGPAGGPVRVFCSAAAHHSVWRSADLLGLDRSAVVAIDTDPAHRMDVAALRRALAAHPGPAIVVATAGTTDAGAVDPLGQIAEALRTAPGGPAADRGSRRGRRRWLHVDAAYGGAALFSDRLAPLLAGISQADSVALDLHKLGWQPVPAGVFLTPDASAWQRLDGEIAYLNPADDTAAGLVSLVGRSLRTTRRADAFKIATTFRALGRRALGAMVDACHDLALHAAAAVDADPRLERAAPVTLSTVLFRYRPAGRPPAGDLPAGELNRLNAELRRELLRTGQAVLGRTELGPQRAVHLKLTLLNPRATPADVDALLALVARTGDRLAGAVP